MSFVVESREYTLKVGSFQIGFVEWGAAPGTAAHTVAVLGPLEIAVPVSAKTGWGVVIVAPIAIALIVASFIHRRKKSS